MPDQKRVEAVRRDLEDIPSLYALLPMFLQPTSGSSDDQRSPGNPARPPGRLDVLDLLDTREKADASPVRDDYDIDRRAGARRQGVLPTLASWRRLIEAERLDEGHQDTDPDIVPCGEGCECV